MIEDVRRRGFFQFHINRDGVALPGPNFPSVRTIFIALLVVGGHNLIKEGSIIAQLGKFADLPPAVLVYPAILKRFLVVPEEEGQMLSLSRDIVPCHILGKGMKKNLELYLELCFS
jgi:hypothetical protein